MGLWRRLFGGRQINARSVQSSQPEGFFIVRYEYGEAQARTLFQMANSGDVKAQLMIAKCFMDAGELAYALPWYEKSAEAGSAKALHELTYFYEGRYIGIQADPIKAERVRNKVLEMNNPEAFLKLASQYYTGDGVEQNKQKAFEYYMKAAQLGNDEAMAEVGACYLNGEGVKQDDAQAFAWLSRSKDGRYGYYNLAQCYLKGLGTPKNIEMAVKCLEKAVSCKCLELYKAREQLVALYSKGYGGANASGKLKRVKDDMEESNRLLHDLADIFLSEEK